MNQLPITNASPVLRTDFTDQTSWDAICDEILQTSVEGFEANVEFIDNRAFEGLSKPQLLASIPKNYPHTFIVVVDRKAIAEIGDEFRAVPSTIQAIENNLSIANMDFAEFKGATDGSGLFRGF